MWFFFPLQSFIFAIKPALPWGAEQGGRELPAGMLRLYQEVFVYSLPSAPINAFKQCRGCNDVVFLLHWIGFLLFHVLLISQLVK